MKKSTSILTAQKPIFGYMKTGIVYFLLILIFGQCTSLLKADFEADTNGSLPNKTLPGAPTGDEITYASEIENQLEVIATPGSSGNKSVQYQGLTPAGSIGGHGAWVSFKGKSSNFSNLITFSWVAQKDFSGFGSGMLIDISDGSGIVAARIKIEGNGDVLLIKSFSNSETENIGKINNNEQHTFLVTVDLGNKKYNLSITKGSGNISKNGNNLVVDDITAYHNPARPTVSFKYESFGSTQKYTIHEVNISRRNS